eukprot:gene29011-32761_t
MGDSVFGKFSVAIVTPFVDSKHNPAQPIDFEGLENMIVHVASGLQVTRQERPLIGGIIVSGTTGEQHTMTLEERAKLYSQSVSIANRFDIPVVAGIAHTTIAGVKQLTHAALDAGCKGIMLGLPPYTRLCDEEIRVYILSVKSLVPTDFPILLYNNSMRNGYSPSLPLLAELCANGTLWGIKHAVLPDQFLDHAKTILELCPSARLYTGSDKLAGSLLSPTAPAPRFYGLTSILGNLYPTEMATAIANLASEDSATAEVGKAAHEKLIKVIDPVLLGTSLPVGLKYALRSKGLKAGFTREPMGFISEEKKHEIDSALQLIV